MISVFLCQHDTSTQKITTFTSVSGLKQQFLILVAQMYLHYLELFKHGKQRVKPIFYAVYKYLVQ